MKPSNLTSEQFTQWRLSLGMSRMAAAKTLGISNASVLNYERGHRENRKVEIPITVALAMNAITNHLKPYGEDL